MFLALSLHYPYGKFRKKVGKNNERLRQHINFENFTNFISLHINYKGKNKAVDSANYLEARRINDVVLVSEDRSVNTVGTDQNVPIWQHDWELQYTSSNTATSLGADFANSKATLGHAYMKEEEIFSEFLLSNHDDPKEPTTYGFDDITLKEVDGIHWIYAGSAHDKLKDSVNYTKCLFTVPAIQDASSVEDQDYRYTPDNLLQSAILLVLDGRASFTISMQLIALPLLSVDSEELPFRIHVKMIFSVIKPEVFQTSFSSTKSEEAQRRLLAHVFASNSVNATNLRREINIPHFLSILLTCPALFMVLPSRSRSQPTLRRWNGNKVGFSFDG